MKMFVYSIVLSLLFCFEQAVLSQPYLPVPEDDALLEHKQRLVAAFQKRMQEQHTLAPGQSNFDALYYKLEIDIHYDPNFIEGSVTGRFRVLQQPADTLRLDFDDGMQVKTVSEAAVSFQHNGQILSLALDRTYQPGEIVSVRISYSGKPSNQGFGYFSFRSMPDGSPQVWSLSEPYGAKYWWPCKDTPTDKPDSVDFIIGAPTGQLAASNGVLRDVVSIDSMTYFHWHESFPIATYLVSLAVGNYEHFQEYYHYGQADSMLLDYYVYPGYTDKGKDAFKDMSDYLDALSHYFGPYPFLREKYGQVQFGWGGGMEHQTMTSIGGVHPNYWSLYVHELGHQWFGDAVTCASWQEIWLNEGFATYSEALYAEWAGYAGYPPGIEAYRAYMGRIRYTDEKTVFVEDTTDIYNIFNVVVYFKGAWVLHMLRHVMGDDDFFTALRQYVSDPRWVYGSVRTQDFQTVCEEVSGLDLTQFFNQWLYYPYFPSYKYEWKMERNTASKTEVRFKITQTQETTVYEMPLDVTFYFIDGSDSTLTIQNYLQEQEYTFRLNKMPLSAVLDKDDWVLKIAEEKIPDQIPKTVNIRLWYPNPFNARQTIITENWLNQRSRLQIFDVLGRLVRELDPINHSRNLEFFEWDGRNNQGKKTASGIYFVRPVIITSSKITTGKSVKVVHIQ